MRAIVGSFGEHGDSMKLSFAAAGGRHKWSRRS
jgi:hypothetical protein